MAHYYVAQYYTTQLSVGGGIDDSQTTGIVVQSVSGLDITKPGIACLTYADPLDTSVAEWITYTSINGSNELQGVARGQEGFSAKAHLNQATIAFPFSKSHINNLNDNFELGLDMKQQSGTPTAPSSGRTRLYFKTDGYLYKENSSGVESLAVSSNQNLYNNSLANGGFDIWQRNTTFTPNDDVYTADQWNFLTETNGAWTMARDTDVPSALGFKYSAKFTNVTLNNQCAIVQFIKNVDSIKLDDQTVSLSFYAKTSVTEIGNLRAAVLSWSSTADSVTSDVIGTWAQDGTTPTWASNWTAENTPSNLALTSSWQRFTVENISIDTASMANLAVVIWTDDGTIAANDDFWITGVQLNQGATATAWTPKSFDAELEDCLQYYEKSFDYAVVPADNAATEGKVVIMTAATSSFHGIALRFQKRKFIIPTISLYNPAASSSDDWRNENDATNHPATADTIGQTGCRLYVNSSSVAAGKTLGIHYTAEAVL